MTPEEEVQWFIDNGHIKYPSFRDALADFYKLAYRQGYNDCHARILGNLDQILHNIESKSNVP